VDFLIWDLGFGMGDFGSLVRSELAVSGIAVSEILAVKIDGDHTEPPLID
jgi:hypothetical protein